MLLPSRQLSCKNGKPCKKQNLQRWRKSREDLTREKPYAAEKAGARLSRDYLERSCYCIDLLIFCGNFFIFSPLFLENHSHFPHHLRSSPRHCFLVLSSKAELQLHLQHFFGFNGDLFSILLSPHLLTHTCGL